MTDLVSARIDDACQGNTDPLGRAPSHLHDADPVLARLIDARPNFDPRAWLTQLPPMDLFGALLFQVSGQQLSIAATRRTITRVEALRDLAQRLSDGRLDVEILSTLPDQELISELTAIPGIGPWTVQGAMIIALGREAVVLPGDLALRKAVQAAYQIGHLPSPEEVLAIAERWRPLSQPGDQLPVLRR